MIAFVAPLVLAVATVLAQMTPPSASPTPSMDRPAAIVDRIFRDGAATDAQFDAAFLAQVSASQVATIVRQMLGSLGSYEDLSGSGGRYVAHFAHGTDDVSAAVDQDGRLSSLWFGPPHVARASLGDALAQLEKFPGTVSYIVTDGTSVTASHDADAPLAVGSASSSQYSRHCKTRFAPESARGPTSCPSTSGARAFPPASYKNGPPELRSRLRRMQPR